MRKIELRVWDNKCNFYFYPENCNDKLLINLYGNVLYKYCDGTYRSTCYPNMTVELFTGICDKNGCKIYDGDIIKSDETVFIIEWDDKHAMYKCCFTNDKTAGYYCPLSDSYIQQYFVVVGNIHENGKTLNK
jgi:hypothetical protein